MVGCLCAKRLYTQCASDSILEYASFAWMNAASGDYRHLDRVQRGLFPYCNTPPQSTNTTPTTSQATRSTRQHLALLSRRAFPALYPCNPGSTYLMVVFLNGHTPRAFRVSGPCCFAPSRPRARIGRLRLSTCSLCFNCYHKDTLLLHPVHSPKHRLQHVPLRSHSRCVWQT